MSERDKNLFLIFSLKLGKHFPERQKNFTEQNGRSHHSGHILASILTHLLDVKERAATHHTDRNIH